MAGKTKSGFLDTRILIRLFAYARPYTRVFWGTVALTVFAAFLSPIRPWLVQYTIDTYVMKGTFSGVLAMSLWMILFLLAEAAIQYYQTYYGGWLGQAIVLDLRQGLFKHLMRFRMAYFDRSPVGTMVTRLVNDMETISQIFSEGFLNIAGDILKLVAILAWMFWVSPGMTWMSLIPIPFLILATWLFKNGIRKSFHEVRNEVANLNTFAQEHIGGMMVVQAFNREEVELKRFKEINARHRTAHIKSVWYYSVFFPVVEVLQAISIALVVWYGSREILLHPEGEIQPGAIFAFILWVYMLYRPMRQLADRFNSLQMGIVSCERIFALLDKDEHMLDKEQADLRIQKGDVAFEQVCFSYVPGEPVIHNLNLSLAAGSTTAIVGSTGSGKTTLISLLSRMYEPDSGHIRIDGIDIREYPLKRLQSSIGIVLQDVFLFSDSIANNIALYNPDISREEMMRAAKAVGADSLINALPGGLDFNVRERGVNLSVGQRQLISFIRAYVYNPQILILDEATSSIDSETENLIQEATQKITQGRTSIVIAHRLSTIEHADRILVMHQGEIAEQGRHEELLQAKGRYWTLFQNQFAG